MSDDNNESSAPAATFESMSEDELLQVVHDNPHQPSAWFQLGLIALRNRRQQQAIDHFLKVEAMQPDNVAVHEKLALTYHALGQKEKVLHHRQRLVSLCPGSALAHNHHGIALVQVGQPKEAIAALTTALELQPGLLQARNNLATVLADHGQIELALDHFRQITKLYPRYAEGHRNLGVTLIRLDHCDEAIASFKEACRVQPDFAPAFSSLGLLYRDKGRLDDALACFRDAVRLLPDQPEPRYDLAMTLARADKPHEAIACLHECRLFKPDFLDSCYQLGVLYGQINKVDESIVSFRQAVRAKPDNPDFLNRLGCALLRQHKTEEAVTHFLHAIEVRPDHAPAHCNLGSVLLEQRRFDEALTRLSQAVKLNPDYTDAHLTLGHVHRKLYRFDEAHTCYQRVLELQPHHPGAYLNIGIAHTEQGKPDLAIAVFRDLLARHPNMAEASSCMGVAHLHQRHPADALAAFDEAIKRWPDNAEFHLNRALCLMLLGDYERGFLEYEWRWKVKNSTPCPVHLPPWDGTPLPAGTIVLWYEQGLGDTIQFIRYAPLVKQRFGKVLFACPAALCTLCASSPGIDGLITTGTPHLDADVQAPLLSLPHLLDNTLETIPNTVPYLFVDDSLEEQWRQKLASAKGLKVGIVWQGNPNYTGDHCRSMALEQFRPLAEVPGVQLFSLQKGKGAEQLAALQKDFNLIDLGSQFTDFRDTAAAMRNLDVVVSVDSSVAHLAGALGVPVFILIPFNNDWRWLQHRTDSPWYPSARLFRQNRWGDWPGVFSRVAAALGELTRKPPAQRLGREPQRADVERTLRDELLRGWSEQSWSVLLRAGLPDTPEAAALVQKAHSTHTTLTDIHQSMNAVAANPEPGTDPLDLIRRFARAQNDHSSALAEFSAWLKVDPDLIVADSA